MVNMVNVVLFFSLVCGLSLTHLRISAQGLGFNPRHGVAKVESRPTLAVNYSSNVKFKLASRKAQYRVNELISLDVAMLNVYRDDLYFLRLERFVNLKVSGENNIPVPIRPHGVLDFLASADNYELVKKEDYMSARILLTIGCEKEDRQMSNPPLVVTLFENAAFVNRGRGCIDVVRPGRYLITATVENKLVVSHRRQTNLTAVGRIESEPLEITVLD